MSADFPHRRRSRRLAAVALASSLLVAGVTVGASPSAGQQEPEPSTTPSTAPPLTGPPLTLPPPTTAAPPATPVPPPTVSTVAPDTTVPSTTDSTEPSTTTPGPDTSVGTTTPTGVPDGGPVLPSSDGAPSTNGTSTPAADSTSPEPRLNDAQVAQILASLTRSGANSTAAVLDILRPLVELGMNPQDVALLALGRFPVGGPATFRDDWLDPRSTPVPHLHKGTDIFAAFGTPARSPADGTLRYSEEGAGGKAAYVTTSDGTWYYLAHLDSFAPELATGAKVTTGTIVGFVGDSGNARGGAPHVHFEVHPGGGEAINPKPILDGWLDEAVVAARELVASLIPSEQRVLTATTELRQLESSPAGGSPAGSVLMWSSSVSAGGGTMRLAEAAAARAATKLDWWKVELALQARDSLRRLANDRAVAMIAPLTHPAITPLLGGHTAD